MQEFSTSINRIFFFSNKKDGRGGTEIQEENRSKSSLSKIYWIVLSEIILYVVLDIIAQSLPPHYSPISQAESDLAVGKYGLIMAINFLNRGILSLLFTYAFMRTLRITKTNSSAFLGGLSLIGIWGIGSIILVFFPTDVPPAPVSPHGAVHLVVAVIAFIMGAFGTLVISLRLRKISFHDNLLKRISLPISVIVVLLCLLQFVTPAIAPHLNSNIGGLLERLFLGSVLFWMAIVSISLERNIANFNSKKILGNSTK